MLVGENEGLRMSKARHNRDAKCHAMALSQFTKLKCELKLKTLTHNLL